MGGISKTVQYKGYRFDIGGHRFFSKSPEIESLWKEILGSDLIERPRKSRIYYRNVFFNYPLKPLEALSKLGYKESFLCVLSFIKAKLRPLPNPNNLEDWVTNQFGHRLFKIFFKTYTDKVWGMSCKELGSDWAAQRIQNLSLLTAVSSALLPQFLRKKKIKTLIEKFRYPRLGPGMMWEKCAELVQKRGAHLLMGARMTKLDWQPSTQKWSVVYVDQSTKTIDADHVILSSPMGELARILNVESDSEFKIHCEKLKYRDFITVALMVKRSHKFDDNWIYIHDPDLRVGRIQNYRSWSSEMMPDADSSCYGLEYFCQANDSLWNLPDEKLKSIAEQELIKLGLAREDELLDGYVIRQPKAYPVYDQEYREHVAQICKYLNTNFKNIHLVGRNGMHKYNNQDHSMMTALLCSQNIIENYQKYDVWNINEDAEYIEDGSSKSVSNLRIVPLRVT